MDGTEYVSTDYFMVGIFLACLPGRLVGTRNRPFA
jgi:hypothetical protein